MEETNEESSTKEPDYYIFRSNIEKNGKILYASDYGKKAFKIPINLK